MISINFGVDGPRMISDTELESRCKGKHVLAFKVKYIYMQLKCYLLNAKLSNATN